MKSRPATAPAASRRPRTLPSADAARTWLLFVHQLPAQPSNLRVRTWRRLQQIGALAVKQAVYVLPDSPAAREDFEWLKAEISASGGDASVFAADTVDTWSNDALVEEFRRTREDAYGLLAREVERLLRPRSPRGRALPTPRAVHQLRERLAAIERVDFFGSAGRDRVVALVQQVEARVTARSQGRGQPPPADPPAAFRRRLWVTRPRPGVDRMASAWLIGRFIDAEARFDFAVDCNSVPAGSVPFDMFGVELTHRGDLCTFEVLCETFHLDEPALTKIGGIVHDLDLKDGRFGAAEAPAVGLVVEGLRLARRDDHQLLADGITLFDALYRALDQAARPRGPRPVARRSARRTHRRPPR